MLTFEKEQEIIERIENFGGFLLLRQLQPNVSLVYFTDTEIIGHIISSKFHVWQGEESPEGFSVTTHSDYPDENLKEEINTIQNLYGFFDNTKIKAEHYKPVSFEGFCDILFKAFKDYADYDKVFINHATEIIEGLRDNFSVIYFLDLDKNRNADMLSEWYIYEFFFAFIAIDKQKNKVTLIEFGLD